VIDAKPAECPGCRSRTFDDTMALGVRGFLAVLASAVVLVGSASQLSKYVRTDGAPKRSTNDHDR
jgi:hypothetical protein